MSDEHRRAGHRIDTAKVIPRAGEEAPAAGWQGEPPAEGTRRAVIRDAIAESVTEHFAPGAAGTIESRDSFSLKIADAVEQALIDVTEIPTEVQREIRELQSEVDRLDEKAGSSLAALESAKALNHLMLARRECVDPAELARINEAITAAHMVVEPPVYAATAEAVREEVGEDAPTDDEELSPDVQGAPRRHVLFATLDRMYKGKTCWPLTPAKCADALELALKDFDGMVEDEVERLDDTASDAPGCNDPAATIKYLEGAVERLLGHREEARTREARFSEERDCAYALLRWLLPVTVAKRLD